MNNIIPEFNDSLVMDSTDIVSDYLELGIDSILDSELAKNIPVLKTIISIGKISKNVRERNNMKNLAIFIYELNSGSIDKEKLREHQEKLKNNSKEAEKELGRILVILDQTIDNSKSSILGKIYKAYINRIIDWDIFVEFSEITNRIYINDLEILQLLHNHAISDTTNKMDLYRIERLNSLGLIGLTPQMIQIGINGSRQDSYITLNKIGKKYSDIIFE